MTLHFSSCEAASPSPRFCSTLAGSARRLSYQTHAASNVDSGNTSPCAPFLKYPTRVQAPKQTASTKSKPWLRVLIWTRYWTCDIEKQHTLSCGCFGTRQAAVSLDAYFASGNSSVLPWQSSAVVGSPGRLL